MSWANTPTLPWALPMYEHMRVSLCGTVRNESLPENLREAAAAALRKLEQYYSLARVNHLNILATGELHLDSHPRFRFAQG